MFSSLRSRLWLSYALIIVTALGIVAVILFVSLLRNPLLYRQTTERLKAVQTALVQRENQDISAAAKRAARVFNVRILLYSKDKQLIFDTSSESEVALPFPRKKVIARNVPLARDENGAAWLYVTEKLPDNTHLVVASPRPRFSIVNLFTDDFLPLIIYSGLIALLLSLAVAFLFARWIADPLQKVILAARTMPSAEAKPVDVRGPHEVQELTRAFNSMIVRTQASQKSQRDFVANVSHELKTPLTSVQGFAQAILDGTADTEETHQQAAQVIYNEAGRMHRMALNLLDLARLDAGTADITMSPVNLPALLNAVCEKFTPQSQKAGVEIKVESAVEPANPHCRRRPPRTSLHQSCGQCSQVHARRRCRFHLRASVVNQKEFWFPSRIRVREFPTRPRRTSSTVFIRPTWLVEAERSMAQGWDLPLHRRLFRRMVVELASAAGWERGRPSRYFCR